MQNILLVEDNKRLSRLIKTYLVQHDFAVECVYTGDLVLYKIQRNQPDLVILDLMLPGLNGLEICRQVRNHYNGMILILTVKDRSEDQITGLEYGADDYVTKPVEPPVLLARIRALLRRSKKTPLKQRLSFGALKIDLIEHVVFYFDKLVPLKPREYELLVLLANHAGTVLSRNTIAQSLRGLDYDGVDRMIDLRISRLRKLFRDDSKSPQKIKTIRGQGYLFLPEAWKLE